jgi:hypothetical protein
LKIDTRIGFIAWKENNVNNVITGGFDEAFTFTPNGKFMDSYNQSWEVNGEFSILNLKS